mgnify:CR=1
MEILLTEKEKKLIEILRTVSYGQVVIHLEKGEPVRIEQIKESVKL